MNPAAGLVVLTGDLPGIGGRIKEHLGDFRVEELPLYEPSGEGTHVYFRIEKVGLATPAAIERIARHMGVRPSEIGVAGLKDARAVASQTMSLEHADADKLLHYRDTQMRVVAVDRHTNKLRPGHLAGNRFVVRVRGVGAEKLDAAQATSLLLLMSKKNLVFYFVIRVKPLSLRKKLKLS